MPPKLKVSKVHRCDGKSCSGSCTNPRVILRPLLADSSVGNHHCFRTSPPTAGLFNKPEYSDIKLTVGDELFYVHRAILCTSSEVFAKMLMSNWAESKTSELSLQEDYECSKVFGRFLYFFYSGTIIIDEKNVIPIFMLADKYYVKTLYDECVKVMENGLKVYVISQSSSTTPPTIHVPTRSNYELSSSSSSSDSSDSDLSGTEDSPLPAVPMLVASGTSQQVNAPNHVLVASETFPLQMVMKLLSMDHNGRIASAALYNLEARLGNQIRAYNYGIWNDLEKELLLKMLSDRYFYCNEYVLFSAAKSWLKYRKERQDEFIVDSVLKHIRFAIMSARELYDVQTEEIVQNSAVAKIRLQEAISYQLFKDCCNSDEKKQWRGLHLEPRELRR